MKNKPTTVKIIDVDTQPSYELNHKLYVFSNTTAMIINMLKQTLCGQYKHYWFGCVPQGFPESEANVQIRNNYPYFQDLDGTPIRVEFID